MFGVHLALEADCGPVGGSGADPVGGVPDFVDDCEIRACYRVELVASIVPGVAVGDGHPGPWLEIGVGSGAVGLYSPTRGIRRGPSVR